jgi:hypothetical protein
MMTGWQEPAALVVVAATAALLLRHAFRSRRRSETCGTGCACDAGRPGGPGRSAPSADALNVPPESRIFQ